MLTIEKDFNEEGDNSSVTNFISATGNVDRSLLKDSNGQVIRDWTYEYDAEGRCISGITMNGHYKILTIMENRYAPCGAPLQSIERDPASNDEIYKVSYSLDDKNRVQRIDYFELGTSIGFFIPDDVNDMYSLGRYFDRDGNEVSHLETRD